MRCVLCWCPVVPCSYGRGGERGTARPEVLQELLKTTDRVVQVRGAGRAALVDESGTRAAGC